MSQLSVSDISKSFGALKVIDKFDLDLAVGERHAVIGPNGAGKTTLFNMISGWIPPDTGRIEVEGLDITGRSPQAVTQAGLARSFQKNTLFDGLTVAESLRLAVQAHSPVRFNFLQPARKFGGLQQRAHEIARQMELETVFDRDVNTLSYGQKRQLEVGIALACSPKILLLDEPAAGTSPAERATLVRLLTTLPDDVTLLLVEHDMDVVFGVCERITVLNYGRVVASGTPDEIRRDPEVRAAYLGESAGHAGEAGKA
ncbi:MAG: ABC transporter ATP-binding protein [Rhodobiaceae bacterium]|nr:ABC transporter ATP-binding protein [Rhodobiaceae bacterium]MCC0052102.1 ABC transporter ATP-binding protein [Rhodobiaceae bacterium]MCC0061378.1 ABC transporter ATP-binding protein [Rhodobiaceae bacterium]